MNFRGLLFPLLLLSFHLGIADDRIVSIVPEAKLFTTEQNGVLKLYRVADTADIAVNNTKATFQQLAPGQTVAVKTAGAITAVKVAASGLGGAAASSTLMLRSVTVQMKVDGTDRVFYSDGKLWIEHMAAKKPTDIFINGIAWSPKWQESKSEPFTTFTIPVAPVGQSHISFKHIAGRGKTTGGHSTAAAIEVTIEDGHPGADDYEFQLSW